ncbi:MAG: baseplate wedge protein 53 [Candidatus Paceibacterota bacterium]
MQFFDKFPTMQYKFQTKDTYTILYTNILLRLKVLDSIKNNMYAYYEYVIAEEDSIEILAEKYYGSPEFHWIIALANDMVDPLFDWPKKQREFINYIKSKYESISNAQSTIHHYEKVIKRTYTQNNSTDEIIIEIVKDIYDDLAESSYEVFNLEDGSTIEETITKRSIDCYVWEQQENEKQRNIKLIKREYVPQIAQEFNRFMVDEGNISLNAGLRSLRG